LLGKQKRLVSVRKRPVIEYNKSEAKAEAKKLRKRLVKANSKLTLSRADRTSGIV
jgi:hypothetical protein